MALTAACLEFLDGSAPSAVLGNRLLQAALEGGWVALPGLLPIADCVVAAKNAATEEVSKLGLALGSAPAAATPLEGQHRMRAVLVEGQSSSAVSAMPVGCCGYYTGRKFLSQNQ